MDLYLQNSLYKHLSIVLIFVACSIAASNVKGQNQTTAQLDSVITDLQSLLQAAGPQAQLSDNSEGLQQVYDLFEYEPEEEWIGIQESEILEAQKQQHRQNKGLSVETGYLENFDQGVFRTDGIYYDRRFQMGHNWGLFKNGWLDNVGDAKILATEQNISRIRQKQMLYGLHYRNLTTTIDFIINRQQATHLKNYLAALSIQQNQLLTLYDMGYKPWQEVRDVMGKQAAMEMKLQTISKQQQLIQKHRILPEFYSNLPVLAVNIDPIENVLQSNVDQMRIDSLRLNIIRKENSAWRDVSLSANGRYNFYSDHTSEFFLTDTGDRDYFLLGINLSVPFTVFNNKDSFVRVNRNEFNYKNELKTRETLDVLRRHVSEYQALLEEYSIQYQQHLIQTDQVYVGAGDQIEHNGESPASKLSRVLYQFEIKGKLIETKRNLYYKLIQISSLVPELPIANFTEIYDSGKLIKETNRVRGLTYEE